MILPLLLSILMILQRPPDQASPPNCLPLCIARGKVFMWSQNVKGRRCGLNLYKVVRMTMLLLILLVLLLVCKDYLDHGLYVGHHVHQPLVLFRFCKYKALSRNLRGIINLYKNYLGLFGHLVLFWFETFVIGLCYGVVC